MNHKDPFFSVIVPTRNRSSLIGKAIKSVLDQSFSNWELLIIDDGSTDDTREIVSTYHDIRIKYHYKKHAERSSARNYGIELAKGKYICFLDDDDYYLPAYLSDFYTWYQTGNPETILRTGFSMLHKGEIIQRTNYSAEVHGHPVNYAAEHMCGVWTLAIPKLFLAKDKFPEKFPHWQDTHLILRLLERNPFHQLDTHNYIYIIHEKMGSRIYERPDAIQRIILNIEAKTDLFSSRSDIINRFDYNIERSQVSAQWAQHCINALYYKKIKLTSVVFARGLKDQKLVFIKKLLKEVGKMIKNKIANSNS